MATKRRSRLAAAAAFAFVCAPPLLAAEKNGEVVNPFYGSFSYSIPIEVPGFHGLEPRLALGYSSEGRNGQLGVGWSLAGFSVIQRVSSVGRGSPMYSPEVFGEDRYTLDGQELRPCVAGSTSPSCTSGGTHFTRDESFLKIKYDPSTDRWTVWGKDGTRTQLVSITNQYSSTIRWGQGSTTDTKGSAVTYSWSCGDPYWGDCYPDQVTYGVGEKGGSEGYRVRFKRETRPDMITFGWRLSYGQTFDRIRSILVETGSGTPIRGYKLTYAASPTSGKSLLASVQQFGRDFTIDAAGAITGGTSLLPTTFTYQNDSLASTFSAAAAPVPSGQATEPVNWHRVVMVSVTPNMSSLRLGATGWYGASSTRAISSGDGYMEFVVTNTGGVMAGLSNGDTDTTYADIDYAVYQTGGDLSIFENGYYKVSFTASVGAIIRVEVAAGVVRYKRNGAVVYTSSRVPTYPLGVDTALSGPGGSSFVSLSNVTISGDLVDVGFWCMWGSLYLADFDGDSRTDQACSTSTATEGFLLRVALANPDGSFGAPTVWLNDWVHNGKVGDFNNDGKADLLTRGGYIGIDTFVYLSTGSSFLPAQAWGPMTGYGPFGYGWAACDDAIQMFTGDFNGDGRTDVGCRDPIDRVTIVGLSTGSTFSFAWWSANRCDWDGVETNGSMDINGDGRDDWYCLAGSGELNVDISNGSEFLDNYVGIAWSCSASDFVLTDLNGDGRTDAVCKPNGHVALSGGNTLVSGGTHGGFCTGGSIFAADVDGDGSVELVCNNPGAPANDIQIRRWTGSALASPTTALGTWCNGEMRAGDFNGDGKTDLFCRALPNPQAIAGTANFRSDLMASVQTPIGGTTSLTWTPSTDFQNSPGTPPKYAIASLTTNDGRGGASTTTYAYEGGLMNMQERRFMGFRKATTTSSPIAGEAAGPYTETWFRQDVPAAGRVEKTERRDGNGLILSGQTFEYTTTTTVPYKALLTGSWSYSYDGTVASCASWPCANGKRTYATTSYDAYGNPTQSVQHGDHDAAGDEMTSATSYSYNMTAYIVDKAGRSQTFAGVGTGGALLAETQVAYDGAGSWSTAPTQGYPTLTSSWLDAQSRFVNAQASYDSRGNPVTATDATGRTTQTAWDSAGLFPLTVTNPAGESVSTTWDTICGTPLSQTDPNGQTATLQYDALCRPTSTSRPDGSFEQRSYVDLGNPSSQRIVVETPSATPGDGSGNDWAISAFDGLGRTVWTGKKGANGQTIVAAVSFNARGGVAAQTAPYYDGSNPETTSFGYDAFDRPTLVVHPDNNSVATTYGLWSRTTADENGKPVTERYDAYGRVVQQEKLLGGSPVTTTSTYDLLGRLVGMADDVGHTWSWSFDSLGRNLQKSDPDAGTWSFEWDDAGRLTAQTDAKSQRTEFTYDLAGRLASKVNAAGTVAVTVGESRPGYFNAGRVTTISAPGTALTTDYDNVGRPVRQTRTVDGVPYTIERRYDSGGFLRGITYPDGDTVGTPASPLGYDAAGRLYSVPGILNSVTYDAAGRALVQTNANGTATTRTYTAERGFLTRIQTSGASAIQDLVYNYDPAGLVTQVTSPFQNEAWDYGYDDLYRMTQATSLLDSAQNQSFSYDTIGRITWNSRIGAYTYPGVGQPRPHAPATVNGAALSYDLNGNLVSGNGRTPAWTADNTIASVTTGGNTTSFAYDGFGERLKKTASGVTSIYPFGDDYEVTNGVVTKYVAVYGLGVIAKRVGSGLSIQTYWLHTDRLGSIQAVTDTNGAEVLRRTFRAYGETIATSGSHVESRGWIDQRNDAETGLTYLHARYYDPGIGVFLSPDPIGADLNAFGYSSGDPINRLDPGGLDDGRVCLGEDCTDHEDSGDRGGFWVGGSPTGSVAVGGGLGFVILDKLLDLLKGIFGGGGGGASGSAGAPPVETEVEFAGREPGRGRPGRPLPPPPPPLPPLPPPPPPGPGGPGPGGGGGGSQAAALVGEFLLGVGPSIRYFGPESPLTQQMMFAPGVQHWRNEFRRNKFQKLENRAAPWGLVRGEPYSIGPWNVAAFDGAFSTLNPLRQVVGGYTVSIYPRNDGYRDFVIMNPMSLTSFAYHALPSYPRWAASPGLAPAMGTTYQYFYWRELNN